MSRQSRFAFGTGAFGVIAWLAMAAAGASVMPSYLGAWLFCLALPAGSLPVVMLLELFGITGWPVLAPLRRLLILLPAASVFAIPVMLRPLLLYHHAVPGIRMIAMLVAWSLLALLFMRPPRGRPRRAAAALGLCLHLLIGTLVAFDWVLSLDPGLASSAFGLLSISGQISAALCAASLVLAASAGRDQGTGHAAPMLLAALGGWMFLHFIQFLIVWSANLPAEILWYQARSGGLGGAALWFGFAAIVLSFALLLPPGLGRRNGLLASISAMLLLLHLVETLWLVTPSFRRHFVLSLPDLLAVLGLVGLSAGLLSLFGGRHEQHV